MSLASGTRLGPYEIQSAIGAGGMGEVYKARDTRLDRTVAIKVLPPDVSADPDRRARFEREAKTIAGLNHSHICTLYDVGDHDGALFLVMEHLAGQTLAERLEKGALPPEQALTIASEIAEALSAAHRQGIVHRDLKPGNVMLTKAGAKLLDFGLARLTHASAGHGESATLTTVGTVVGTVPYMAPEQIEGRPTDTRTDLFAFGAVLYEMMTGKRAFGGTSPASVMAAILEHDPAPVLTIQPLAPPALQHLIARCLAKDPDARWQSAVDVAGELRWIASAAQDGASATRTDRGGSRHRAVAVGAVSVLATACLVAAGTWAWLSRTGTTTSDRSVRRYELSTEPAEGLGGGDPRLMATSAGHPFLLALAVSPDGRHLVFSGHQGSSRGLYMRDTRAGDTSPISGTQGGQEAFFSPDGAWIGFWRDGKIQKVPLAGGPPTTVCDSTELFGASWATDGTIVFASYRAPLRRVSDSGGGPEPVTALQSGEVGHLLPHLLPGGLVVLYNSDPDGTLWPENLRSHQRILVLKGDDPRGEPYDARYVPTGHLVYARRGTVEAVPFSRERLVTTGRAVPIVDDVMQSLGMGSPDRDSGQVQVALSPDGTLYYVPGGPVPPFAASLVWRDLAGGERLRRGMEGSMFSARISPDGTRVAIGWEPPGGRQTIAIHDIAAGTTMPMAGVPMRSFGPVWSADGTAVAFGAAPRPNEPLNLYLMKMDGSSPPQRLTTSRFGQTPAGWSPDGRTLVFVERTLGTADDLWFLRTEDGQVKQVEPWLRSEETREASPALSRDGRWLAYMSSSAQQHGVGDFRVFVAGLSPSRGPVQVSPGDGRNPVWSPDGRTLYYTEPRLDRGPRVKAMMAVDIADGRPVPGRPPRELFTGTWMIYVPHRTYDLSPDGRQFLFIEEAAPPVQTFSRIKVVVNWLEELKQKVPPAR